MILNDTAEIRGVMIDDPDPAGIGAQAPAIRSQPGPERATTILIVDDNVNLARGFAQALTGAGYAAHTAHTAEEGLRLAQLLSPDAIILDIRMPFINGVGFLYRLREFPAHFHTPVMVVTGASLDEETRAELCDLRALLRFKPLKMSDLLAETHRLVRDRTDLAGADADPRA